MQEYHVTIIKREEFIVEAKSREEAISKALAERWLQFLCSEVDDTMAVEEG